MNLVIFTDYSGIQKTFLFFFFVPFSLCKINNTLPTTYMHTYIIKKGHKRKTLDLGPKYLATMIRASCCDLRSGGH